MPTQLTDSQLNLLKNLGIDPNSEQLLAQIDQQIQALEVATATNPTFSTQLHIAETEKYNHVTYFLNGGQDKKWPGEDWIVIPSNKVASHAEIPQMKAEEVTDKILEVLKKPNSESPQYNYIIVNYANPDMVGHTGDIEACITSMEFLDKQLGRLLEVVENQGHEMIIIADHGNMEFVGEFKEDGKSLTDTEHNASPVPCIFVGGKWKMGPELELAKTNLLTNLKAMKAQNVTDVDLELMNKIMQQANQVDLSDSSIWLNQDQVTSFRAEQMPLWYAGSLLLGL